jgi:CspA family cold shock protein
MQGTVKRFSDIHGYGFIIGEDGEDYFVHQSQIKMPGFRSLEKNENVTFEPKQTPKGNQAVNIVKLINAPYPSAASSPPPLVLRKNPFTPQDPIKIPSKFAGRKNETIAAIRYLFFDGANILIEGPRGIGKSSFAHQILQTQKGNNELLERHGIKLPHANKPKIACLYGCMMGDNLSDIANGLIKALKFELTGTILISEITQTEKIILDGFEKSKDMKEKDLKLTEVANDFSLIVRKLCVDKNDISGIVFLIDEIDVLDKDILLAPFFKSVCENFSRTSEFSFSFVLCGVTGTITRLIREHRSSSRLFQPIALSQFIEEDILELIEFSLNGSGVSMEQRAKNRIAYLSNRFPHPAQQLGYYAFNNCNGDLILYDHVVQAQEHIVKAVKEQEFSSRWNKHKETVQSQILQAIAKSDDTPFTVASIKKILPTLSSDQILGGISNLQKEEVIDRLSVGSNKYVLREPLYKIYLQWIYQ